MEALWISPINQYRVSGGYEIQCGYIVVATLSRSIIGEACSDYIIGIYCVMDTVLCTNKQIHYDHQLHINTEFILQRHQSISFEYVIDDVIEFIICV